MMCCGFWAEADESMSQGHHHRRHLQPKKVIMRSTQLPAGSPNAVATSPNRLTDDGARRISKLITRLPELVELERDLNKARSRRKPPPLRPKPVTIGDLIRDGKLLEVHCSRCRPERHLYLNPEILRPCRCQRWPSISSAASAVPGIAGFQRIRRRRNRSRRYRTIRH